MGHQGSKRLDHKDESEIETAITDSGTLIIFLKSTSIENLIRFSYFPSKDKTEPQDFLLKHDTFNTTQGTFGNVLLVLGYYTF